MRRIAPLLLLVLALGCAPRQASVPFDRDKLARDVKAAQLVCLVRITSVSDYHQETGLAGVWTGQLNRAKVVRWLKGSAKAQTILFLTPGDRDYLDPGEGQLVAKERARMPKVGASYLVLLIKRHPSWYETYRRKAIKCWYEPGSPQARHIESLLAKPEKSK